MSKCTAPVGSTLTDAALNPVVRIERVDAGQAQPGAERKSLSPEEEENRGFRTEWGIPQKEFAEKFRNLLSKDLFKKVCCMWIKRSRQ